MSDYADVKVNGGTRFITLPCRGWPGLWLAGCWRELLRMWNLIGMCAFCLNRWHRTWVSRAIPWRERGTDTQDTQPPFGNPTVPPGDAFDIIAQSPPITCHRKHQGLGTPEIHLTAHPKKGLVIGCFGRCQIFVFFLSAWILRNNLGPVGAQVVAASLTPPQPLPLTFLTPSKLNGLQMKMPNCRSDTGGQQRLHTLL